MLSTLLAPGSNWMTDARIRGDEAPGGVRTQGREAVFFFEKRNQKTFAPAPS
jgi:hypothetical protein